MPETSQDAFETLHPKQPQFSVEEIRARSNSFGSQRSASTSSDPNSTDNRNSLTKNDEKKPRINVAELEKIYGYKREISHR